MTRKKKLSRGRAERLLSSYGADSSRYPRDEIDLARRTFADDLELQAGLTEAADLDILLNLSKTQSPSTALQRTTAEIPIRHPRLSTRAPEAMRVPFPLRLWPASLMGLLAGAMGVFWGLLPASGSTSLAPSPTAPSPTAPSPTAPSPTAQLQDENADELEELASLTFAEDFIFTDLASNEESSEL